MQIKLTIPLLVLSLNIATAHAGAIIFYNGLSCSGTAGSQFRNPSCNYCYNPPPSAIEGANSVAISSISPDERWNIHTGVGCSQATEVWQDYGPRCYNRGGGPPIRSVFIGCVGNKLGFNSTVDLMLTGSDAGVDGGEAEAGETA